MQGVEAVLTARREPPNLARAIVEIRQKITLQHRPRDVFDVKYAAGGLIDLDFLAQFLLLCHACDHPQLLANNSVEIFDRAAAAGILDRVDADDLIAARKLMHRVQGVLRLAMAKPTGEEELPLALREMLVNMTGRDDFDALRHALKAAQDTVRGCFERIIDVLVEKEEIPT
jgi:glutamate-ammonia-ligase adenylyltransferase